MYFEIYPKESFENPESPKHTISKYRLKFFEGSKFLRVKKVLRVKKNYRVI